MIDPFLPRIIPTPRELEHRTYIAGRYPSIPRFLNRRENLSLEAGVNPLTDYRTDQTPFTFFLAHSTPPTAR